MNEWNIQSRSHQCQACAKPFAVKEPYHTLLSDLKQEIQRVDVCAACWQAQYSEGARERKGFISHWQGVYEVPAAAPDPIGKETAETLLRKLIELNDPKYTAAGYILAVMLERKRLLKVKEQFVREGRRFFLYEHPRSGDLFTIQDPDLQLNQLEQVQRDVAALLEQGLNPAAAPSCPPTPGGLGASAETGDAMPAEAMPGDAPALAQPAAVP